MIQGKGVSSGIAIAPLREFNRIEFVDEIRTVDDVSAEIKRFNSARTLAAMQLGQLAVELSKSIGEENSLLFEIHKMMLEDLDYTNSVEDIITKQNACAEYAVSETARQFSKMFADMDDDYMKARASDVLDISRRVMEILSGKQGDRKQETEPAILISDDFAPSETAKFDRSLVKGLITTLGSANSHTAIFARTMGIPAIIGIGEQMRETKDGTVVIMDGSEGIIHLNPDDGLLEEFKQKMKEQDEKKERLNKYLGKPTITKSGKKVNLYANIGNVTDAGIAMENDAEGIGLFRSEFLYLESNDFPSEDTQFDAYKAVAEKMSGRMTIIRTLDIGADKQADYFNLKEESNPAMGMRAIRICLTRPEIFKTQLRAIYRASAFGKLSIMLPMIVSVSEVQRSKKIIDEVKADLRENKIPFDEKVPVGIMIETPAAAMISDLLAKEVDFFSIGSNDLTQYTLAVDRMNHEVADFCDDYHEAILRMMELVIRNAHNAGIWAGICGELASDVNMTEKLLSFGIDELSINPPSVLTLREKINNME